MSDETDTAARYRERAERLRRIADDKTAREIRNHLLSLADTYERLATTLEDIDATNFAIETGAALAISSDRRSRP